MLLLALLLLELVCVRELQAELGAHYTRSPESVTAPLEDTVAFFCQTNIPWERVAWRHRPLGGAWRELPSPPPPATKLQVELLSHNDAGDYRCVSWYGASALASAPARLSVAHLNVSASAASLQQQRRVEAAPGTYVLLRCFSPPSEPPATLQYYRVTPGQEPWSTPLGPQDGEEAGGALLLKATHNATYACSASNDLLGEELRYPHNISVAVVDHPPQPPTFMSDMLSEVSVKLGGEAVLSCAALGWPAPSLSWRRSSPSPSLQAIATDPKHPALLRFSKLQVADEGTYICTAQNSAGSAEKVVRLWVLRAPTLTGGGGAGGELEAPEGGSLRVPCGRPQGRPPPTLTWLINGDDVLNTTNTRLEGSDLVISRVEKRHAGVVQCFASNVLGSADTVSLLRVIPRQVGGSGGATHSPQTTRRPGRNRGHNKTHNVMIPPSRPNVTRLSDESVMVRWSVEDNLGLSIQFFKVQYRDYGIPSSQGKNKMSKGGPVETMNQIIPPHVRSYEVDGLQPDHVYKFRIAAVYSNNDNEMGRYSSRFLLQRGLGAGMLLPPAPSDLQAAPASPTDLLLSWHLPSPPATPVEGFYVYYRPASSAGTYNKAAVEGGDVRQLLLSHLEPGVLYELKLQSFTPAAASHFSPIITQRTHRVSVSEPGNVISPGGAAGSPSGSWWSRLHLYSVLGGALLLLLTVAAATAACLAKKRQGVGACKQSPGAGLPEPGNGFVPSGAAITITDNPLPPDNTLEMRFLPQQNNNSPLSLPQASRAERKINTTRDNYV